MSRLNSSLASSAWNQSIRNMSDVNQSLNQTNFLTASLLHRLEAYTALPVLVIEAISTETVGFGSLSVKISERGWAWLVCGRRLFVWKFKSNRTSNSMRACPCYELELPPTDLAHKSDLVAILLDANSQAKETSVAVVAVSPEGTLRYWPNVAYESHSFETAVHDLHGQECYLLTNINQTTCILGTSTNSLVCITIGNGESGAAISFRTLKVPQGMLAGLGKRVTSFIFGSNPGAQSSEARPLTRILKTFSSSREPSDSNTYVYVLAGSAVQKWSLCSNSEKLLFEQDVDRTLRDAFLEVVWSKLTTLPNQLQLWTIDASIGANNELIVLVACINRELANDLYFGLASFEDIFLEEVNNVESRQLMRAPLSLKTFSVFNSYKVDMNRTQEDLLLNYRLLASPTNLSNRFLYVYDHQKMLCIESLTNVVDVIDFETREDGILGAGFCDSNALLFTYRDALVSLIPLPERTMHSAQGQQAPNIEMDGLQDEDGDQAVRDEGNQPDVSSQGLESGGVESTSQNRTGNAYEQSSEQANVQSRSERAENQSQDSADVIDEQIRWHQQIQQDRFGHASQTLLVLAQKETVNLAKKKTLLSLSKLAGLVAGNENVAQISSQLAHLQTLESNQG